MTNHKNGLRVIVAACACACCIAIFASATYACKMSGKTCTVTDGDTSYCFAQNALMKVGSMNPKCTYQKNFLNNKHSCKLTCI